MDQKKYSEKALRTDLSGQQYFDAEDRFSENDGSFSTDTATIRLLHGVLGLVTEAGEVADYLKRFLFYGKPEDLVNVIEELGDSDWYRNLIVDFLAQKLETTREDINERIAQSNIAKLANRYPQKFSGEHALARDTDAERQILEKFYPNPVSE